MRLKNHMQNTSPEQPDGDFEFLKRVTQVARDQMIIASGGDAAIVAEVVNILARIAKLAPNLPRLREIVESENHPLFNGDGGNIAPELKTHMRDMRKAQVGALLYVIKIMTKTQVKTTTELPAIEQAARKRIVDESISKLWKE